MDVNKAKGIVLLVLGGIALIFAVGFASKYLSQDNPFDSCLKECKQIYNVYGNEIGRVVCFEKCK